MFESHSITNLFLTAGGSAPAVFSIGVDSQAEDDRERRPLPASAYAIDLGLCRGVLACGTRAGTIHLFPVNGKGDGQEPAEPTRLLAGRAITSLCFATDDNLISADESGRVLQWGGTGKDANHPARWDCGGDAVCLLGSTGEHVIGLGDEGQVFVRRACDASLEARLVAPAPARPIALARLATIGHDDGFIRLWRLANDQPVCIDERPALYGVIDAEVFFAGSSRGIAVLSNGRAVRFTMTQDSFTVLDAIPGKCYRAVAGTSVTAVSENF